MTISTATNQRHLDMLTSALGPDIMTFFDDKSIIEIMLNPDGQLFVESQIHGKYAAGINITAAAGANIVKLAASINNQTITAHEPVVATDLPIHGARFQGWLPPVVTAPCFAIRKPAQRIFTLADYCQQQAITKANMTLLQQAVLERNNIIIAGGTSSGKTTFANALLHELRHTDQRLLVLEDLPELQVEVADKVALVSSRQLNMRQLVAGSLRMRPDRIIIGEVRDGAALELLKAWNTGHPGGICTIHANSIASTPARLEDLIGEVAVNVSRRLISEAIDMIVFVKRNRAGKHVVDDIAQLGLDADGNYTFNLPSASMKPNL